MGCSSSADVQTDSGKLTRPHIFFLLGGPGCGKGTQAENLVRDYRFKHLSTGDLLRQEQQKGGQLAEQIKAYMKEGKMFPSSLVVKLLKVSIQRNGNRRYLIDGFPRNQENLEEFNKQLKSSVVVRYLIFLDCPQDVMVERIMHRAKTSGRDDDNPQTVKKRLQTFDEVTIPILKSFQSQGNCIRINANQGVAEVYNDIRSKFKELNVCPPPKTQMLFILGGPGSGKGTQCDLLVKKYGFIHLSTGDMLRQAVANGSPVGNEIGACLKEGKLVSSELMVALIREKIEKNNYDGRYLLDGFPRGQENINVWQKQMADKINLKGVLNFDCDQAELKRRLLKRGETSGRSDDNQEAIAKRLKVFNEQTKPAIAFFQKQGKLHTINANQQIQNISKLVQKTLDSLGIFPQKKPIKKPTFIVILGTPGSGKDTQCHKIVNNFKFVHIATGQILRQEIKNKGPQAELIADYMKKGKLVPSDLVVQLIHREIKKHDQSRIFLVNGFPRNKQNLNSLNQKLGVEVELKKVILLECSKEIMNKRLAEGNQNIPRPDDTPETISQRFETYQNETLPMIRQLCKTTNVTECVINGEGTQDEVYKRLKASLEDQGFCQK